MLIVDTGDEEKTWLTLIENPLPLSLTTACSHSSSSEYSGVPFTPTACHSFM